MFNTIDSGGERVSKEGSLPDDRDTQRDMKDAPLEAKLHKMEEPLRGSVV